MRLFMSGQCERRGLVSLQRVAALTGVEIWSRRELSIVLVFVAIDATRELDFKQGVFAFRDMTLGTLHSEVFPFERIGGGRVIFRRKGRGFEAVDGVASGALRSLRLLGELAIMRVGLVTIHAGSKRDGLFEISTGMAKRAVHDHVLSLQRVLRLGVIEVLIHHRQGNPLPTRGAVAGLAALREAAMMRIRMAIGALRERQSCVPRFAVGAGGMALFTLHLRMRAGQRIPRFGVIKLGQVDRLPVGVIVTLQTTRTQPSLMRVLMAGSAGLRYSQKTARQVLHLDRSALLRCDVIGTVAASASHARMFSFENVSGKFVVERLGIPLDQRKILAVMFGVATRALLD